MADQTKDDGAGRLDVGSAQEMNGVNLEHALVDFEIANARVVDLTGRVTTLSKELLATRTEVGELKLRLAQQHAERARLETELAELRRSLAYRVARGLGDLRARAMRR